MLLRRKPRGGPPRFRRGASRSILDVQGNAASTRPCFNKAFFSATTNMLRLAVAALAWRAAGAYDYGDRVRVRAKSRGGGVETEWIDVVSPSAPNFREASAPLTAD